MLQAIINDIKAFPAYERATSSAHAHQQLPLIMRTYDTIIFYRAGSYSAAAAAELYRQQHDEITLFYAISSIHNEPNIATLITRNTKLVFFDAVYVACILNVIKAFASSVTFMGKLAIGQLAREYANSNNIPWWVQIHINFEQKKFDCDQVSKYAAYINEFGLPVPDTYQRLTNIAPHTFFSMAQEKYVLVQLRATMVCDHARLATFYGYSVYVIYDCDQRHHVCHLLFKRPDCDFVVLIAPKSNYTSIFLRGSIDTLNKKQINLASIAIHLGGAGGMGLGTFHYRGNVNDIIQFK